MIPCLRSSSSRPPFVWGEIDKGGRRDGPHSSPPETLAVLTFVAALVALLPTLASTLIAVALAALLLAFASCGAVAVALIPLTLPTAALTLVALPLSALVLPIALVSHSRLLFGQRGPRRECNNDGEVYFLAIKCRKVGPVLGLPGRVKELTQPWQNPCARIPLVGNPLCRGEDGRHEKRSVSPNARTRYRSHSPWKLFVSPSGTAVLPSAQSDRPPAYRLGRQRRRKRSRGFPAI
jgi:hypothetical protein